jgi:hypothetical protein
MKHSVFKVWTVALIAFMAGGVVVFANIAIATASAPVAVSELTQFTQATMRALYIIEGLLVIIGGLIVYIFKTSIKHLGDYVRSVANDTSKNKKDIDHVKEHYLSIEVHDRICKNTAGKVGPAAVSHVQPQAGRGT